MRELAIGAALLSLSLVHTPLPQPDFHEVRHHDAPGEVCEHHDHLLRWHPGSSASSPRGVAVKPTSAKTVASALPSTDAPSARSTVSRPSAPSRTARASASAAGRSTSGASVKVSSVRPPRST